MNKLKPVIREAVKDELVDEELQTQLAAGFYRGLASPEQRLW
jgi:hypothetical protein